MATATATATATNAKRATIGIVTAETSRRSYYFARVRSFPAGTRLWFSEPFLYAAQARAAAEKWAHEEGYEVVEKS